MRQGLNPAVINLERELADLRRKLTYYERLAFWRGDPLGPDRYGLPLTDIDLGSSPAPPTLVLPLRAKIRAAREAGLDVRVRATTHEPNGESIGTQYYISDTEAYTTRDQAALLAHLHEQFCHELAGFIR